MYELIRISVTSLKTSHMKSHLFHVHDWQRSFLIIFQILIICQFAQIFIDMVIYIVRIWQYLILALSMKSSVSDLEMHLAY